jgi:hypothetical protein
MILAIPFDELLDFTPGCRQENRDHIQMFVVFAQFAELGREARREPREPTLETP